MIPTVTVARRTYVRIAVVLFLLMSAWAVRHIIAMHDLTESGTTHNLAFVWVLVYGSLAWHLVLAWREPQIDTTPAEQDELDKLYVTMNVPVYNEDPDVVHLVLTSVLQQTRLPNRVQVVDDGSDHDYGDTPEWWLEEAAKLGIDASWVRIPNQGKRHAQLHTFRPDDKADIFITIDSDTVLERRAIEEGLKPFKDAGVASVAAVILAQNAKASWFTRLTDPWLLAFQLCVRSALSRLGSVLVNSGNLSFYRAEVLREAFDSYERETFLGRPMQFSDDSLLTLFSYLRGRTVQQPTSFAFTVLPENVDHHIRQQLRWMRGSFIRSWWRFRYLPVRSFAYWEHFASWVTYALVTMAFFYLMLYLPLVEHRLVPLLFLFAIFVAYATAARYLTIRRSDQSFAWQLGTFALTPVMLIWTYTVLRPLRIYAMLTARKTGWGTRGQVEVELAEGQAGSK